jgi:small subunit ribosomal protein S1
VREFGAFVDLGGGVQGLLHVSEMGWSRVSDSSSVVKPGEEITVKVLRVDDDQQKISLGLKQLTEDPWSRVHATYEIGKVVTGRVTRLAEFGAFVELEPGIEGLAHASTFVSGALPVGANVEVVIVEVDPAGRRIRLSVNAAVDAHEAEELREYTEREDATPAEGFGSLADKLRGALKPREK